MEAESTNEYGPKSGRMSNGLIKTLIENYRQNHLSAINETLGIQDAHSIWFDLPKLKKFIAMIEEEAMKKTPDATEEDLGIRFYYAAYPKLENWNIMESHPVSEEYAGRHTLVMIPTVKKTDEEGEVHHYDFNTLDQSINLALTARRGGKEEDPIGENNGQLIPPSNPIAEYF
ncbi:hypothetical protein [Chryseobacterium rhizosphaerae]|uniref:hypothetical protein n=1 Tax=Chryseobacterium rhizosphaerae TaxID=395937 RepID=UPI0006468C51|nr:hypothetical protein [Chryseobacterium rhizosphaerae]MDC8101854.1 hypothetical protein [Chryseobacterium rhizosphaerae]